MSFPDGQCVLHVSLLGEISALPVIPLGKDNQKLVPGVMWTLTYLGTISTGAGGVSIFRDRNVKSWMDSPACYRHTYIVFKLHTHICIEAIIHTGDKDVNFVRWLEVPVGGNVPKQSFRHKHQKEPFADERTPSQVQELHSSM